MKKYQFTQEKINLMEKMHIPFAIYQLIDNQVCTLVISQGFCDLFGYDSFAQAYYDCDHDMYKDTYQDDVDRILIAASRFAERDNIYNVIYRSKNPKGSGYNIIHAIGEHIYTDDGTRLAQVWYTNEGNYVENGDNNLDLTNDFSEILYEDSQVKANYYDYLTGLPSMTHFFELAETARDETIKKNIDPVLLYFDFSGMKFYNEKYGFFEGDRLLRSFAKLLAKYFGKNYCSRYGQDHFAAFTNDIDLEERLKQLFVDVATINEGRSLPVRVGIYKNSMEYIDAGLASDRAKIACNSLRDTYASSFAYFSQKMREEVNRTQYIIDSIDKAIENKWIQVYFQSIVRAVNGRVCDEEALARWIDPVHGIIQPTVFVPALESVKLIYKLDLYIIKEVVEKLRIQKEKGLYLIHQSINLSRYDFDSCDIVEEIKKIVDGAGIPRNIITIEITESAIGSNYELLKHEIGRFKELGFSVWMDDFGSGYSSLNVLQSIKFDLIKFDMHFMRSFNDDNSSRILLQELTKMASALGITTVCEGVETEEQVKFLQEIGVSKLQGFYFSRPTPLSELWNIYYNELMMQFEDPRQTNYYELIGKANLYDLSTITAKDDASMKNVYKNIPMGIIEVRGNKIRFSRSNQMFRKFMIRGFDLDITKNIGEFIEVSDNHLIEFVNMLQTYGNTNKIEFVNRKTNDNYIVNYLIRNVAFNNVKNTFAVVVAVLAVNNEKEEMTYAKIASALARDYFNLFYVDLETEDFMEYNSQVGKNIMALERKGKDFFNQARNDALDKLYYQDQQLFINAFTKEKVLESIKDEGAFTINYRLFDGEKPTFVNMKVTMLDDDNKHIIVGVSSIDKQMKEKAALEQLKQDQITYARMVALSGDFICLYVIDPISGKYVEYSASKHYEEYGFSKSGDDFFYAGVRDAPVAIAKDDLPYYLSQFKKDNILATIKDKGLFKLKYRMIIENSLVPVCLKATIVKEDEEEKMIVGINRLEEYNDDSEESK